jgi:hypothetical protein
MFIEDGKKIDDMSPSIDNITLLVTVIHYSIPLFVTNDHVLENTSNDVISNRRTIYLNDSVKFA